MDVYTWLGVGCFVAASVLLYVTRNKLTWRGRLILVGGMFGVLGATVYRIDQNRSAVEKVWHPQAIVWKKDQVPLLIFVEKSPGLADYHTAIMDATAMWSRRIGCAAFGFTEDPSQAQLWLRTSTGEGCDNARSTDNPKASASTYYCGGHADVQFRRLDDIHEAFRIVMHELGHGAGLDDDGPGDGIMWAGVMEPQAGDPPDLLLISNKDAAALHERLCQ